MWNINNEIKNIYIFLISLYQILIDFAIFEYYLFEKFINT